MTQNIDSVLPFPDQLPEPLLGTAAALAKTQKGAALAQTQKGAAQTGSWRSVLLSSGPALPTPGEQTMDLSSCST